jgi:membrane protein implicated in regulation of membrane protease activity
MNALYFWISVVLICMIIELSTSTFYGLALAIAAAIVASYVYIVGDTGLSITQSAIFAIASLASAYILPWLLASRAAEVPQGFDRYLGEKRSVKKTASELKISLDGVEYGIESDDDIAAGDKVEII